MKVTDVKIEAGWKAALQEEFGQPYFAAIKQFLVAEKQNRKVIYPPGSLIFNAFDSTPFDKSETGAWIVIFCANGGEDSGISAEYLQRAFHQY